MTKKDNASLVRLLRACDKDYPAQSFVAFDSASRPCVILHFDDANGHRDFMTCYFSSLTVAMQAFLKLDELLGEIGDYYAEKTDCPLWQYRAKK